MSPTSRLILASASPRRRELLACLGLDFAVIPSGVEEGEPEMVDDPAGYARDLATAKANEVAARNPDALVLAADTIVVLDGRILGKPAGPDEACRTLRALRKREHEVTTGLALVNAAATRHGHVTTSVLMRDYSDREIAGYIASGDPFDKAGSYAIQDIQFQPVEQCRGCYCNVVGLPVLQVHRMLREAGAEAPDLDDLELLPECRTCPLGEAVDIAGDREW